MTFARDGFATLPGFVAEHELADMRTAVDETLALPLPPGCERPHNTLAPLRWDDPIVRALLTPRRVAALNDATAADDIRFISAYVSVKDAHSAALSWHRDWWCWDHPVSYRPQASQVAVLCYLADTTEANAALRVVPGSHLRSTGLDNDRTLEARAGDAVVIDYRLLHGTYANCTHDRRTSPPPLRWHAARSPAQPRATRRLHGDRMKVTFTGSVIESRITQGFSRDPGWATQQA
jgi:Phytanoyl-CoA dioxygenase (PhyH)